MIGVEASSRETKVELGDGKTVPVREARATIKWLDKVRVLVSDDWMAVGDAPTGLLGTGLLAPHLLFIDFANGTVEIETQD